MKITQLRLRRFKRFADYNAAFAPGLTVVRGPNGAGKTTLLEAVFEGLFGGPARPEDAARLRPWGEDRLGEVTMDLDVDGGRWLLRRDLEAGTILLQRADGGERVEAPRDVHRRLLDWLGLASEGAYRTAAFVGHADLARITDDRRLLATHLSRVLSGAGIERLQEALQVLGERRTHLTAALQGPRSAPHRIADLRAQQAALRQRDERLQRHHLELDELVQRAAAVERELEARAALLREIRRAADLRERQEALASEEAGLREQLTRVEEQLRRLAELDEALAAFSSHQEALVAGLFQARRQYLQVQQQLAAARDQAAREERALERLATAHHAVRQLGPKGWTLATAGAIGVAAGAGIVTILQHWLGWIVLAAGGGVTVVGMRYRGRIIEASADYRQQEQRVLELRRRVGELQEQLAHAEAAVTTRLQAMGSASLEDVERRFSSYMDQLREREELRAALRTVWGPDPRTVLEHRLQALADELASLRAALEEIPRTARGPAADQDEIEQQVRQLTAELHELRERRARLEAAAEELRDRGDEVAHLEEEIATLEARAARDRQALQVTDLALRMLDAARSLSVYPARRLLERRASEYLATATGGVHTRITLDERTLRPLVGSSAGGWREAADLGQGTADQLYFCLRLALLDVMAGDRRPPLFLDEPFAHLDETRRAAMLPLLVAAARERQVVLSTAWPHFDAVADRIILLEHAPAPA
ncbi:MAG: SMC family ATPase [Armatimonadota bacterium]|nr:SMC family ATPase [Armatimonadota bacterium]MDR7485802.1 SMC family ATPase [Armatimonadota bacterium]MDR7532098.1 SMC family ATPase [Armatimonadota bacterium]MDR7536687.1 SMC family ATPase [Armatimonadota bacterium]